MTTEPRIRCWEYPTDHAADAVLQHMAFVLMECAIDDIQRDEDDV